MRKECSILILFFGVTTFSCNNKPLNGSATKYNCEAVLDSAEVFVQTSEYAINIRPTISDPERNLSLDNWFRKFSFKDFGCLLENKSITLKALGFVYAIYPYKDSLLKYYGNLLNDTSSIRIFGADGTSGPKIQLGKYLSSVLEFVRNDQSNFAKRPQIEDLVSTFIQKYSMNPGTYRSISFPYFSISSEDGELHGYKIHHEYEILNNEGINQRVVNAFVLDKNLIINIIEKDSTSYGYSYPPKFDYWLKEFGRDLSKTDSITLKLR